MNSKYEKMIENLKSLGSVAVAFSGGVDSTFLLKAAKEALGNNALAVTVRSCIIPSNEICEAEEFCKSENIRHIICDVNLVNPSKSELIYLICWWIHNLHACSPQDNHPPCLQFFV